MQKTSLKGKKINIFSKQGNSLESILESLASIHKKNATPLETSLLKNCGKFLVCHPKIGVIYTKKVATEKHRFAASKEA